VAPVAGQNFGARLGHRVKGTFYTATKMATGGMTLIALGMWLGAATMVGLFSSDPLVIAVGEEYLHVVAWSFVGSGITFVTSSMFQAMGNTIPALITSGTRIVLVAVPVLVLARMPGFALRYVWYVSAVAVGIQLLMNLLLLQREFRRRLAFEPVAAA
jgi:Na+-driven multidrug efflux pump